jgi:hypothetical protein
MSSECFQSGLPSERRQVVRALGEHLLGMFDLSIAARAPPASWRDFFRYLRVREEAGTELVDRFAEWFVERKLASRGYRVVSKGEEGCDIRAVKGGEEVYVEVKGRRSEEPDDVKLTELESQVAHKYRERYWLVVVIGIPNNPRALVLRDLAQYRTEVTIPGRKLKECSEEL